VTVEPIMLNRLTHEKLFQFFFMLDWHPHYCHWFHSHFEIHCNKCASACSVTCSSNSRGLTVGGESLHAWQSVQESLMLAARIHNAERTRLDVSSGPQVVNLTLRPRALCSHHQPSPQKRRWSSVFHSSSPSAQSVVKVPQRPRSAIYWPASGVKCSQKPRSLHC